jgi:hypothetical protein
VTDDQIRGGDDCCLHPSTSVQRRSAARHLRRDTSASMQKSMHNSSTTAMHPPYLALSCINCISVSCTANRKSARAATSAAAGMPSAAWLKERLHSTAMPTQVMDTDACIMPPASACEAIHHQGELEPLWRRGSVVHQLHVATAQPNLPTWQLTSQIGTIAFMICTVS